MREHDTSGIQDNNSLIKPRGVIRLATEGVKITEPPLDHGPRAIDVLTRVLVAGEVVVVSAAPLPE